MDGPQWSRSLRSLAGPALSGTPLDGGTHPLETKLAWIEAFADEMGHRRPTDRPFLAHLLGCASGPTTSHATADVALWWALHDPTIDHLARISDDPDGPLLGEVHAPDTARGTAQASGIEVATERELSALHAAWWLSRARRDPALHDRVIRAATWHVQTLQPDNATNHPWAVHVFLDAARDSRAGPDAILHAQTLVHNAMVMQGRLGLFSACLLLDAARAIEAMEGNEL